MTVVTGTIVDTSGRPIVGTLWAKVCRFLPDGTILYAPQAVPYQIVAGQVTADLAPGPARLAVQVDGRPPHRVEVVIPDSGSVSLASLIGLAGGTLVLTVTSMQDFAEQLGALNGGTPYWAGTRPAWDYWTKPELGVLLDTTAVTDMLAMYYGAASLTSVPAMDTSNVTDMRYMFYRCGSLTSAPLYNVGVDLDMGTTILTPASADVLMQGLKTVTSKTLNLPATAQGCNPGIATSKGWTVT